MKKILDNIKAIRAIKGYSQEYVANKLGCDYSTYGKIENGKSSLTVNRLFRLAEILEVEVQQLLHDRDAKEKDNNNYITEGATPKIIMEIPVKAEDLASLGVKDLLISLLNKMPNPSK
jgi:transcriptional regulator with XRE-family HTH domain